MAEVVRFENVGLRYGLGPEVLQDITFGLEAGSFHFLIGPSGAGKSSLLRLMYLAHRQTRGLISLFGRDTSVLPRDQLPKIRRRIGVMFQDFRLLPHLTAFDNVALPLRVAGVRESEIKRHVEELLVWVALENHMDVRPPTMSGGQQQRVAIARAVIARPKILYADEPTGNVDDRIAARLMHLFGELNKLGTTVVIATHNEAIVQDFGRPVLKIDGGRLRIIPHDDPGDLPEESDIALTAKLFGQGEES
jgi:cell division transport system ATP-binding protein